MYKKKIIYLHWTYEANIFWVVLITMNNNVSFKVEDVINDSWEWVQEQK